MVVERGLQHGSGQGRLQGRQPPLQGGELPAGDRRSTSGRSRSSRTSPRLTSTSASSHQSLYRPGKEGDENKQRLDQAVEHYEKSLEVNKGDTPNLQQLRINTLGALTAMYSDPPLTNYEKAIGFAEQLVKDNPNDAKNLYAMANLYEKFDRVSEAEQTYVKVDRAEPERRQGLRRARGVLQQAALGRAGQRLGREPVEGAAAREVHERDRDAREVRQPRRQAIRAGFYKLAMFYWDKAYRDPLIGDKEKDEYADKGLAAVDTALGMKPDYWEAIITKGLLFRVKAQVTREPEAAQAVPRQGRCCCRSRRWTCARRRRPPPAGAAAAAGDVPPEATATPDATKKKYRRGVGGRDAPEKAGSGRSRPYWPAVHGQSPLRIGAGS